MSRRVLLTLSHVLLAYFFTWHIFSADGTRTLVIDSDLYDSEAACLVGREIRAEQMRTLGQSFEIHECESPDRMPR